LDRRTTGAPAGETTDERARGREAEEKARAVRHMFSAIAPSYDLLNHALSLNRDRAWRRAAIDRLLDGTGAGGLYLDTCAGTLDLARELAARREFRGRVVATDFAFDMLRRGLGKVQDLALSCVCADTLHLPFADGIADGATVGFGVRNLASLEDGLRELARVLRPGGRLVVLEFAVPARQPFRAAYLFYFRRILPWIGRIVSRHGSAYAYLPASVMEFPSAEELARRMRAAGFEHVRWTTRTAGIVTVHVAERVAAAVTEPPRPAGLPRS